METLRSRYPEVDSLVAQLEDDPQLRDAAQAWLTTGRGEPPEGFKRMAAAFSQDKRLISSFLEGVEKAFVPFKHVFSRMSTNPGLWIIFGSSGTAWIPTQP